MSSSAAPTRNSTCCGPRAAAPLRPEAADRADDADSRRARRRAEDVEIAEQRHRHQRAARRDVRQADEHLRRADVEVLGAAHRPEAVGDRRAAGRRSPPARCIPWRPRSAWRGRLLRDFHGEAAAESADENWARMFQQKGEPQTISEEVADSLTRTSRPGAEPDSPAQAAGADRAGASGAEASRKIAEGAVKLDGETVTKHYRSTLPSLPARIAVRLGKRRQESPSSL